jgi:methionine-rich copper-binding protein CopC
MNKIAKVIAAFAIATASLFPNQTAFAHTELETSNPEANSVIGAAPSVVSLTFGEDLMIIEGEKDANQVQVTNGENSRVDNGDYQVNGKVLTVSLKPDRADDTYKVGYRVVSADGHPIEGGYEFHVNGMARSGQATPVAVDDQSPVPLLYDANSAARTAKVPDSNEGAAIGAGVAVGAVLIGGGMFFLFRRIKSQQK